MASLRLNRTQGGGNGGFTPEEVRMFTARRKQREAERFQQTQATRNVSGRGGPLTSFISEAAGSGGALGGAAGGAALGSAAGPVGTAVGGILGGIAGGFGLGFGGRAVENKIRDDEFRVGDALKEGAISGAFGAFGGLGSGAKGLSLAGKGAKTASKAQKTGKVSTLGDSLIAKSRGITAGAGKTSTRKGLSVAESKRLNKVATDLGLTKNTPQANLEALEGLKNNLFTQRSSIIGSTKNLGNGAAANIKTKFANKLSKTPGVGKIDDIADDLAKLPDNGSAADLVKFREGIDDAINFTRNPAAPNPKLEKSYKLLRDTIDDEITKVNPGYKTIKKQLSDVYSLEDLLQDSTKAQNAGTGSFKVPIAGTKLPAGTTQTLRNVGGKALRAPASSLNTAVSAGSRARGLASTVPGRLAVGSGVRGLADADFNQSSNNAAITDINTAPTQSPNGTPTIQNNNVPISESSIPQGQLTPEVLQRVALDMVSKGAPVEDVQRVIAELQTIGSFQDGSAFAPEGDAPLELNNTAITTISDLETSLDQLDNLKNTFENSSANNPVLGRLRGLNPFDTDAQRFDSELRLTRQIIGKGLEGGVLRKEDEAKYEAILPNRGDTDASAFEKIDFIKRDIENKLQEFLAGQQTFGGGATSLSDQLGNL